MIVNTHSIKHTLKEKVNKIRNKLEGNTSSDPVCLKLNPTKTWIETKTNEIGMFRSELQKKSKVSGTLKKNNI